jgi:hypothetical protein
MSTEISRLKLFKKKISVSEYADNTKKNIDNGDVDGEEEKDGRCILQEPQIKILPLW